MVIRAAKHSLNRLLRSSGTFDHPYIVSHFLNCLLGSSLNASPVAETPFLPNQDVTRTWTSISPSSLRTELLKEIESRFRYNLPENWIDTEMLKNKTARELCLRVGIQLVARVYDYSSPSSVASTETHGVSSNKRSQAQTTDTTLASKKKNKKKSGKAAVNGVQDAKAELPTMTFTSDDVLNIMPVVKSTVFRVGLILLSSCVLSRPVLTYSYPPLRVLLSTNASLKALALSAKATSKLENSSRMKHSTFANKSSELFILKLRVNITLSVSVRSEDGSLHSPSQAELNSFLNVVWHNLSQRLLTSVGRHELAEQALKELASTPKSGEQDEGEREKQIRDMLLPNVEAARSEAESYLQQAVRMVRQSIIICERTSGIDSHEAVQQYADLGLLEQAAGNVDLGLKLSMHAVKLWNVSYGPVHPTLVTILVRCQMSFCSFDPLLTHYLSLHSRTLPPWFKQRMDQKLLFLLRSNIENLRKLFTVQIRLPSDKPHSHLVKSMPSTPIFLPRSNT